MRLPLLNKNECIIPICYAWEMGYFNKHNFEFTPHFHDGIWTDHDLFANGEIPMIRGDYSRYLGFKEIGLDPQITHTFSRDFQILTNIDFTDVKELDGLDCLLSIGTSVEFYLEHFCKEAGIKLNKIHEKEIEVRYDRFLNGEAQVVMIPEPYASKLINKGCKVVHDIRNTDINIKVYMWDKKFLAENPEVPQKLMDIIDEATIAFNNLDDESQYTYLLKYNMVESRDEYTHKNFELNLPITDKSLAAAKEWYGKE